MHIEDLVARAEVTDYVADLLPRVLEHFADSALAYMQKKAKAAKPDHPWQRSYKNMQPSLPKWRILAPPLVGIRTFATP